MFDVLSVFGRLHARVVPAPLFPIVLARQGYTPSAVSNLLSRLAAGHVLLPGAWGRTTVYRRAPGYGTDFTRLAAAGTPPAYAGAFPAFLVPVPGADGAASPDPGDSSDPTAEAHEAFRRAGYRPLRPGVLIAFADAVSQVQPALDALPPSLQSGFEPCTLTPRDLGTARDWVRVAWRLGDLGEEISRAEASVSEALDDPDLTEPRFHDLFHAVAMLLVHVPNVPSILVTGTGLRKRLVDLMDRLAATWDAQFAESLRATVLAHPSAPFLEFD